MLYIKTQKKDMVLEFHGVYAREEAYIEKNEKDEDIELTGFFVGLAGIGAVGKYETLERANEIKEEIYNFIPEDRNKSVKYEMPAE